VRTLDYPDRHFVRAAEGWLELGDSAEAARELRQLTKAAEKHPDVLELRWRLYALTHQWDAALAIARAVIITAPERPSGWIHQSYSLHELKRTDEAWEQLLPAASKFPEDSVIPYNLACYACQLGDLLVARDWLQRAVKLLGKAEIKSMALSDGDLAPLRDYIEGL
jgi:predicted Zn-dependent protease